MTVKERLVEFIKYKGISKRAFCISINVSDAFVSSIVKSIQPDKIERITLCYPELNTGWLLTGEGSMIKVEGSNVSSNESIMVSVSAEAWDVIKKQAESLASKDRQMEDLIGLLKKVNAHEENNVKCADVSGSDLEK